MPVTIQELETAGVAGIMIEDTVLPRTFRETKPGLLSIEEGMGKMRAALAAREDKALTIIGRTSAAVFRSSTLYSRSMQVTSSARSSGAMRGATMLTFMPAFSSTGTRRRATAPPPTTTAVSP